MQSKPKYCANCGHPIRDGQATRTLTHKPIARSRYQWAKAVSRIEVYHADCGATPEAIAAKIESIRNAAKAAGIENDPAILQAIAQVQNQSPE